MIRIINSYKTSIILFLISILYIFTSIILLFNAPLFFKIFNFIPEQLSIFLPLAILEDGLSLTCISQYFFILGVILLYFCFFPVSLLLFLFFLFLSLSSGFSMLYFFFYKSKIFILILIPLLNLISIIGAFIFFVKNKSYNSNNEVKLKHE